MLTKAEILWTRKCNLSCSYCAMVTGEANTFPIERWKIGIGNLSELGCKFAAIYGAEPLEDFNNLPEFIKTCANKGIDTTLITSGITNNFRSKIRTLISNELKSLSMSYDIFPLGKSSSIKSNHAIDELLHFKSVCTDYRDVAAICTLTRTNYNLVPKTIEMLSDKGIWFLFDMIHPNRNQPGSKCKGESLDLLFTENDKIGLFNVLQTVLKLKSEGYLVHVSQSFVESLTCKESSLWNYTWNCTKDSCFPSWITINQDGTVRVCDDYYNENSPEIFIDELYRNWDNFTLIHNQLTKSCPGCCWNTHYDSHRIKEGLIPFSDYNHSKKR